MEFTTIARTITSYNRLPLRFSMDNPRHPYNRSYEKDRSLGTSPRDGLPFALIRYKNSGCF